MTSIAQDLEKRTAQSAILDCLQRFSLQQFTNIAADAKSLDLEKKMDLSNDHWVASVLLSVSKAQVLLRVHFSSAVGRAILAEGSKEDPRSIQPASAHDFLKEFCNVVMGRVKGILTTDAGVEEAKKVFLPSIEPSFDRFGVVPDVKDVAIDQRWWRIEWGGGAVVIFGRATASQGFTDGILQSLAKENIVSLDDGGDIDFF
jgi:hypothetical protein